MPSPARFATASRLTCSSASRKASVAAASRRSRLRCASDLGIETEAPPLTCYGRRRKRRLLRISLDRNTWTEVGDEREDVRAGGEDGAPDRLRGDAVARRDRARGPPPPRSPKRSSATRSPPASITSTPPSSTAAARSTG